MWYIVFLLVKQYICWEARTATKAMEPSWTFLKEITASFVRYLVNLFPSGLDFVMVGNINVCCKANVLCSKCCASKCWYQHKPFRPRGFLFISLQSNQHTHLLFEKPHIKLWIQQEICYVFQLHNSRCWLVWRIRQMTRRPVRECQTALPVFSLLVNVWFWL